MPSSALAGYFESQAEQLSKSELVVHEYIMSNPEQVIYSSIKQLSEIINVGEATVFRYVKKLGYDGFTAFKLDLFKKNDEIETIKNEPYVEQVASNMIKAIEDSKNILNEKNLDEAAKLINSAKKVLIIGKGLSHVTAQDTYSRLIRIGIDAIIIDDSHFLYMYSATLDKDTTVICYTHSGETYEVIKAAKICEESGCNIIGITNYEKSSISNYADVLLYTRGFEQSIMGGSLSAKVAQLFISDVLITRVSLLNEKRTKKYIEKTTQSVFDIGD